MALYGTPVLGAKLKGTFAWRCDGLGGVEYAAVLRSHWLPKFGRLDCMPPEGACGNWLRGTSASLPSKVSLGRPHLHCLATLERFLPLLPLSQLCGI